MAAYNGDFGRGRLHFYPLYAREINDEGATASGSARHIDRARGIGDDAVNEREAEARALADLLGGEERLEDARERRFVHAGAGVFDGEPRVAPRMQRAV